MERGKIFYNKRKVKKKKTEKTDLERERKKDREKVKDREREGERERQIEIESGKKRWRLREKNIISACLKLSTKMPFSFLLFGARCKCHQKIDKFSLILFNFQNLKVRLGYYSAGWLVSCQVRLTSTEHSFHSLF